MQDWLRLSVPRWMINEIIILKYFPHARTLLSFVCLMNRGPIRSPARSAANLEFHASYDQANEVARQVVTKLESMGMRAMNPSVGFPMEMDQFSRPFVGRIT